MSDLAATAAFVAAGLSLVNVGITAMLASRGQREQWRRDEERPVVARYLALSGEVRNELRDASVAKKDATADPDADPDAARNWLEDPQWEKSRRLLTDLAYEGAPLDLLASSPVRSVARDLYMAHLDELSKVLRATPGKDDTDGREAARSRIEELEITLIEAARADLGLGLAERRKSLLGMLRAAINGP